VFGFTTLGALAGTEVVGTIMAINQRTWFGPGNCNSGNGIFTPWGCGPGIAGVHEFMAFVTVGLYATTGI
jgi:hypothetical protein